MENKSERLVFIESEEFDDWVAMNILPDDFIDHLINESGLLYPEERENSYDVLVYNKCNNGTAWLIKELGRIYSINFMVVCMGSFNGNIHTWLRTEDYYLDLTLQQFGGHYPRFAICLTDESLGYIVLEEQSVKFWIEDMIDQEVINDYMQNKYGFELNENLGDI